MVEEHQESAMTESENVKKIVDDAIESGITEAVALETSEPPEVPRSRTRLPTSHHLLPKTSPPRLLEKLLL